MITTETDLLAIDNDHVVKLVYELRTNEGELIEIVNDSRPLEFYYGAGHMLPKFEEHLKGLREGDKFQFRISNLEAYGPSQADSIIDLDLEIFRVNGEIDREMLAIGNTIPMTDNHGSRLNGRVLVVGEDSVKMDFNHPLAEEDLNFTGSIVSVREASNLEKKNKLVKGQKAKGGCGCGSGHHDHDHEHEHDHDHEHGHGHGGGGCCGGGGHDHEHGHGHGHGHGGGGCGCH